MQMSIFKENMNPDFVRMDFIQEGVLPGWGREGTAVVEERCRLWDLQAP